MKILFLFTGGTIGSTEGGGRIGPDSDKPKRLLAECRRRVGFDFDCDAERPYTALSENNTGETVRLLLSSVAARLNAGYDGVVVTHGTDTLAYSAAALSYAFANAPVPICVVSANLPVEQPQSNGYANLCGALRFIREVGAPGVWVPYQNRGKALRVHRGARLLESPAFSDRVESALGACFGHFTKNSAFVRSRAYREMPNALPAMGAAPLGADCREILRVTPCPGMTYPALLPEVRAVLHGSFHSGTINTVSASAKRFFVEARERGVPVFLTGVSRGAAYESTAAFASLGVTPIPALAPAAAYMKLWMWLAANPGAPVTAEILQSPLGGDIIPEN